MRGLSAEACYWCGKPCHGTCLRLTESAQMIPGDPAYHLLSDGRTTTPVVYRGSCYICRDPEYAQMGLSLCRKCESCADGHVPADDTVCTDCGHDEYEEYAEERG